LNVNPTFTTGTAPWTAAGGTLTRSSAHTQGGLPFSGLLTPNGVAALCYASSEQVPVTAGAHYTVNGWLYSPTGHAASLSVNWFDWQSTYLTTSSSSVTLAANTWTRLTNVFPAPSGATYGAIVPTEAGTPAVTDLLYLSDLTLTVTDPVVVASVAEVTYDAVTRQPSGTTLLA
jgi:hypothetical protein